MKRCPACQSIYTDDTLSYCLQDGSKLAAVSDSASASDATWQMSGGTHGAGAEPPPTEILRPEEMPTARMEPTAPTVEQQRARRTARADEQQSATNPAGAPRRSSAPVIALSAVVALLLVALGGVLAWIMMRDRGQTETRALSSNSNQADARQANTTANQRANSNANPPANTTPQPSPVDVAAAQKEVQAVLNAWAETVRQRNLDEHMKYYADTLEVYYNAANVGRDRVRADRAAAFSQYTSMEMELSNVNISIDPSGTRATATFDKTFDFRNEERSFNGSGLNRFWLVKAGGRWRITGEKDLKTYYVNK